MDGSCPKLSNSRKAYSSQLKTKKYPRFCFIYNKKWYYYLVPHDSYYCLFDEFRAADVQNHLIVKFTRQVTLYAHFGGYHEFWEYQKLFSVEDLCFYEIITGAQKPYFDIDIKFDDPKLRNYFYAEDVIHENVLKIGTQLVENIVKSCHIIMKPNELDITNNILLFTSHSKDCVSYHIVIDGWYHLNCIENGAFYNKVKSLTSFLLQGRYVEFMDSNVYKRNQAFRLLGSHKHDSFRVKKIETQFYYFGQVLTLDASQDSTLAFARSLVGFVGDSKPLQSFHVYKTLKINSVELSKEDISEIEIMLRKEFKNLFTIRKVEHNIIQLSRRSAYWCQVCLKKHMHENPRIIVTDGKVNWDCRRNEQGLKKIIGCLSRNPNQIDSTMLDNVEEQDDTGNFITFGEEKIDLTNL